MARVKVHLAEIDLDDFVAAMIKDEEGLRQVAAALIPHLLQSPLLASVVAHALLQDRSWLSVITDEVADRLVEAGAIQFPEVEITDADRENYDAWYKRHFGFDKNLSRRLARAGLTLEDSLQLDEDALAGHYGISRDLARKIVDSRPKARRVRVAYPAPDLPREEPVSSEFSRDNAYRWYKYWWRLTPSTANRVCSYNYTPEQLMGDLDELLALPGIGPASAKEILKRRRIVK